MKIRVIDFETTGLPEDQVKAICEVGFADVGADGQINQTGNYLVNPGHPIPPVTRAVHHISDAEVAGAPAPAQATQSLMNGMEAGDMFAAHNAEFEQAFFNGGDHHWICTLKCAQHLWPEAPRHSNQVLRYWLGIDTEQGFDAALSMPPHRAGPDAYVTAFILRRLLLLASPEELVRLTTAPILLRTVTFGKHRGQAWADLPVDYLRWVSGQNFDADVMHTVRHYLGKAGN